MARRRKNLLRLTKRFPFIRFGEAGPLKLYGYPKENGRVLADGHGRTLGTGRKIGCTRIRPGAPGSWISNERCSYQFVVGGTPYSCRGMGDGVSASCRKMKTTPRGLRDAVPAAAVVAPVAPPAQPKALGRSRRRR